MPKRSCSSIQPSTQPGTVAVRMSWRIGIVAWPSARSAAASAPEPARPVALRPTSSPSGVRTMANRSPPRPHRCGAGDGDRGVGGDRRVDGVAAPGEDLHRRLRGQLVGRRGHRAQRPDRGRRAPAGPSAGPYRRPSRTGRRRSGSLGGCRILGRRRDACGARAARTAARPGRRRWPSAAALDDASASFLPWVRTGQPQPQQLRRVPRRRAPRLRAGRPGGDRAALVAARAAARPSSPSSPCGGAGRGPAAPSAIVAAAYAGAVGAAVVGAADARAASPSAPGRRSTAVGAVAAARRRRSPCSSSAGRRPSRRSPPLTAADEHVLQDVAGTSVMMPSTPRSSRRSISAGVVDRPHVHLDAAPVARRTNRVGHDRDAVHRDGHLRRQHGRARRCPGTRSSAELDRPGARCTARHRSAAAAGAAGGR